MIGTPRIAVRAAGVVFPALALLMTPLMLAGCSRHSGGTATEEGDSTAAPEVVTVHPTQQSITRRIEQPGYLRPYEQTPIYTKIPGYVQEVHVDIGDHVHKGELLAKLWVPEMEQDLKSKEARVRQAVAEVAQAEQGLGAAKANVNTAEALVREAHAVVKQAEADYLRWQAEYTRGKNLLAKNVYDKQTLDEVLNQVQQADAGREKARARVNSADAALIESKARRSKAEADVDAAKAKLQVSQADRDQSAAWLDYRNIRAPYDGVVTQRNVHTGHFLQSSSSGSTNKAADPQFVVMRMDIMRVTVQIPEYDAVLVKDGMPAVVRFQAFNNKEILGHVTRSTWSFDDRARTLRVEIHLRNPDELLRPGMYVNVIISAQLPKTFTLPSSALMTDGDQTYCYRVENGKAVRTAIRAGVRSGKVTQVLKKRVDSASADKEAVWEDFSGKEEIVASNPASLIDGHAVSVASPAKADGHAQ